MTAFRRALVIGGSGFVGSHLCEMLLANGTRVVCLDRMSAGGRDNVAHLIGRDDFEWIDHDVNSPYPRLRPVDLVCHAALPVSPPLRFRERARTLQRAAMCTANALETARVHDARMLLVSSSEVYGDAAENPQTEQYRGQVDPTGPRSPCQEAYRYAEALAVAHQRDFGTEIRIARLFTTYGPRMGEADGTMIPNFIQQALAGRPLIIHGTGTQTRSICFVDDIVRGLYALAVSDLEGPVNLGNPAERGVRDTAELVRRVLDSDSPIRHVPAAADDPRRRCPDITLARQELGWSPTVVAATGVQLTAEWFRAHADAFKFTA